MHQDILYYLGLNECTYVYLFIFYQLFKSEKNAC